MRVVILVTHLLGTGHLARAMTLARGFLAQDHSPFVVSGGMPSPHLHDPNIQLVQLPPVRSNGVDFSKVLTDQDEVADVDYLRNRCSTLLQTLDRLKPDAIITELFPFGRRILRAEFEATLNWVNGRIPVFASIRDILAPPSSSKKLQYAEDLIAEYYTGVLVHSDAELLPLGASWPVSKALDAKLAYTGFVAPPVPEIATQPRSGILVSTGGGAVGDHVFNAAINAARRFDGQPWHLLVGGPVDRISDFAAKAPKHVRVEGLRDDFRMLLAQSSASVSLAGYNTVLDLLQTGTPSVLVPFDEGNEVEQGLRARALEKLTSFQVCASDQLDQLLDRVQLALKATPRPAQTKSMDGASETVRIVSNAI